MPVRTGEHVAADEVCVSGSDDEPASVDVQTTESKRKKLYLFSTTDIQTRFCLAFEMADHKDGFNATNLLKDTKKQAGKIPAVFIGDGLPSYSGVHQVVFAAKNPLDKHSVHISDACLNNRITFRNGSTGRSADSKVGSIYRIQTHP